ncbi:Uncharacterised protein [Segatella copri]|nr:Uncharacterised protein [Segatella copri]
MQSCCLVDLINHTSTPSKSKGSAIFSMPS